MQYTYVSIIIPAFNEEIYIGKCLEAITNLNYPKDAYEIIIVDNGSTDKTVSICKNFTDYIYICPNKNASGLRNYGAKNAKGKVYAFIDADCIPDKEWINNAIKALNIELCVTGSDCQIPPEAKWIEKAWGLQMPHGRCEVTHINSGNLIVPADIFNKIGGFEEKLKSGEDYEFSMRAKSVTKVISDDRIKVTHYGFPKTLRQFIKREIWHGLGAFGSIRTKLLDKPLIGTIIFFVFTLLMIISIAYKFQTEGILIFYYSVIGIIVLLILTLLYRIKYIKNIKHGFQLLFLYYLYYIARSISLLYILFRIKHKRSKRLNN